jgi:hypothetical protein
MDAVSLSFAQHWSPPPLRPRPRPYRLGHLGAKPTMHQRLFAKTTDEPFDVAKKLDSRAGASMWACIGAGRHAQLIRRGCVGS